MSAHPGYDQDYYLWFADQAQLLRAGKWHQLDVQHLAEELEDMGNAKSAPCAAELWSCSRIC
jgi:hypothetical protein